MKYIKHILIIVTLVGLFSPMTELKAELKAENPGQCTFVQSGGRFNGQTFTRTESKATCDSRVPPGKWKANPEMNTAPTSSTVNSNYQLLAPLPGAGDQPITQVDTAKGLGFYLNLMIKIFIGLCAVLSVVMIVIGGLQYMTSELVSSKEEGKKRIMGALLGLLIALGAYALLFTINPDLLKSDLNVANTTSTENGENCSNHELATKELCESAGFIWTPNP